MELFLDNDIILKLSSANLLSEIENLFHASRSDIYILPTAFHYISKNPKIKIKYGEDSINNALSQLKAYKGIPDSYIDENKVISLDNIPYIDSGEKILFSLSPSTSEFLILTGDKKSITALNNSDSNSEIQNYLKTRIVFLERLILMLINSLGFPFVYERIVSSNFMGVDKVIKICFNQLDSSYESVLNCLESYIASIEKSNTKLF